MSEHRRHRHFTIEKYPVIRHENVVVDHQRVGHAGKTADRKMSIVIIGWVECRVDRSNTGSIRRHCADDCVVLLARLHRLRWHHKVFVTERCCRDVKFCSADHDTIATALNNTNIGVWITLLTRWQRAVTFRIGDAFGNANISGNRIIDIGLNSFPIHRIETCKLRRRSEQGHERLVGHADRHVHTGQHIGAGTHLFDRARCKDVRVHRIVSIGETVVVALRNRVCRNRKHRFGKKIVNPSTV